MGDLNENTTDEMVWRSGVNMISIVCAQGVNRRGVHVQSDTAHYGALRRTAAHCGAHHAPAHRARLDGSGALELPKAPLQRLEK